MSTWGELDGAWDTLSAVAKAAGPWAGELRSGAEVEQKVVEWTTGWKTVGATASVRGRSLKLRLYFRLSDKKAVLRIDLAGQVKPSDLFDGLRWGGGSAAGALDFVALQEPTLYLSNYDSEGAIFNPVDATDTDPNANPVVPGVTLVGRIEEGQALSGGQGALLRPLQWAIDETHALPAKVMVSVGSSAMSATFAPTRDWTPLPADRFADRFSVRLFDRSIGVSLDRESGESSAGEGEVEAREAPSTVDSSGETQPAKTGQLNLESAVDVMIDLSFGAGFPKKDTAPMTLGVELADKPGGVEAEGWMRLRPDPKTGWQTPFGIPGLTVRALYARMNLIDETLDAFRGDAAWGRLDFDVAMALDPQGKVGLFALRNAKDISLFGLLGELLGLDGLPDGPVLRGRGPESEGEIDLADYTVYVSSGEQEVDGTTWPQGMSLDGRVDFWGVKADIDVQASWTDDEVTLSGHGLSLNFGGAGCALEIGRGDRPLCVTVTRSRAVRVAVDYRLALGPVHFDGAAVLDTRGWRIDGPLKPISHQKIDVGLTRVGPSRKNKKGLRVEAYVSYAWTIGVKFDLPRWLKPLDQAELDVSGELHFAVEIGESAVEVELRSIVGELPQLGVSKTFGVSGVTLDLDNLDGAQSVIKNAVEDWARGYLPDPSNPKLSDLGRLLRGVWGIGAQGLSQLLAAGAAIPGVGDAEEGLGELLGPVADAFDIPGLVHGAASWAAGRGLPLSSGTGGWLLGSGARYLPDVLGHLPDLPGVDPGGWVPNVPDVPSWVSWGKVGLLRSTALGGGSAVKVWWKPKLPKHKPHLPKWPKHRPHLPDHVPGPGDIPHGRPKHRGGQQPTPMTALAAGGVLFTQQKKFGGEALVLPPGRYPKMPGAFAPQKGTGNGANALVVPPGMFLNVWRTTDFGDGRDPDQSFGGGEVVPSLGDLTDKIASAEVGYLDHVTFFRAATLLSGSTSGPFGLSIGSASSAPAGRGPVGAVKAPWLVATDVEASTGVVVPPGLAVEVWYKDGTSQTCTKTTIFEKPFENPTVKAEVCEAPVDWAATSQMRSLGGNPWTVGPRYPASSAGLVQQVSTTDAVPTGVFATLRGASAHYAAWGVNGYQRSLVEATGSENFVFATGLANQPTPLGKVSDTSQWGWDLVALGLPPDFPLVVQGSTSDFVDYGEDGVQVVVHHDRAWSDGRPAPVFTALQGVSAWAQTGAGATTNASEQSFVVSLTAAPLGQGVPPLSKASASAQSWELHYFRPLFGRAGVEHDGIRYCADRTEPGEGWQVYSANTLKLVVDISDIGLTGQTRFITSISGDSSVWTLSGGSAVYYDGPTGFTVFVTRLDSAPITPADARVGGWHINWMAVNGPLDG